MAARLKGIWHADAQDESLQKRFWEIFPQNPPGSDRRFPWHGEIRARYGAGFLRRNRAWLD